MAIDCVLIGFNDESMETSIKRVEPYKEKGAAYYHMLSRSALLDSRRLKFSQLVNESISRSTGIKSDLSIYRMPNMATHYLAQYLRKGGVSAEIVNNYNFGKERIKQLVTESNPLIVGISSTCIVEPAPIREVVDYVKSFNNDAIIVVGGPFINSINYEYQDYQQQYLLARIGADVYVHERQGEKTLLHICRELKKGTPDLSLVPNILYRNGEEFSRTTKVPEDISLDDDPIKNLTFYEGHPKPPVYVRTALSCNLRCAFCRYPILGGEYMCMGVESVEKNLDYIHTLGVRYLVFIDDSLNIPEDRFKAILRMMIEKEYGFKWFSFFRISHSDGEMIELMAKSGCTGVLLGVESGNNTILKNMDKQVTREKLLWGINELKKHGIITYASCMIGFAGETEATARETINFIEEAKPDFFDLQCWFYENAVPIAQERAYYSLDGYGYAWSHKDMDSGRAAALVTEFLSMVKGSCFMPSLSFNLWSLAYYISQGATVEEFKEFCRIFMTLISREEDDVDEQYVQNVNKLMHVFESNEDLKANLKSRAL